MDLSPYRIIFWDWNGTLMDDRWLCVQIINDLLKTYRLSPISERIYRDVFDFPVESYYRKLGFDFSVTPFEQVGTEFIDSYQRQWRHCHLHSGARQIVDALHATGLKQVVVSAASTMLLNDYMRYYELAERFQDWVGLDHHYATGKTEVAREYMAGNAIPPDSVLLIGDTRHDAAVARAIGVDCILFSDGHQSRRTLSASGVPIIDSLEELYPVSSGVERPSGG